VVVATCDADGTARFIEAGPAATLEVAGAVDAAYVWGTPAIASLPDQIGAPPLDMGFPGPGGSKLGIMRFPAHSAGEFAVTDAGVDTAAGIGDGGEPDMHRSDTIDYEIILSGKVDIVLPGGHSRTLKSGSILIMAGAPHAWRNHYDEDCTYIAVVLGAHGLESSV
jgi:hypothetical protein